MSDMVRPARRPSRVYSLASLAALVLAGLAYAPRAAQAQTQAAAPLAAAPVYPGPARGVPATQMPAARDFALSCNAGLSSEALQVGGVAVPAGAAIEASTGCGQATLPLDVPGTGRFRAHFVVRDPAAPAAQGTVRVRVIDRQGVGLSATDFTATTAMGPRAIDVDVAGAAAIVLQFVGAPTVDVYDAQLSGSARALRAASQDGGMPPVGATPVSRKSAVLGCNASVPGGTSSVSGVPVAAAEAVVLTGCGTATFTLPPRAQGTFVLRYGSADTSTFDAFPTQLNLRVLDAAGHLLRKAIGRSFIGGGLQPLWVNVRGGRTIALSDAGGTNNNIVITGVGILSRQLAPHPNPTVVQFGRGSHAGVPVAPEAFADFCNAEVGTRATTVGHVPVPSGSYLETSACGVAQLIMTNAHGRFHALFGIQDDQLDVTQASVQVTVLDRTSHPLLRTTVRAAIGKAGVPIDLSIDRASIVIFSFSTDSVLYDMRLYGEAVLYDQVSPPAEPLVTAPGGVALDPRAFSLSCNTNIADQDVLLVHEAALEQWALSGTTCGGATLALSAGHYPRHLFSARFGIPASDQTDLLAQLVVSVLDARGRVLRHTTFTARAGYGPQELSISMAGGATLQLQWAKGSIVVFGMTAS